MLHFRAHHFLCTLVFKGKGYSSQFIRNFQSIVNQLNGPKGDQMLIRVTQAADSICTPCPHRTEKLCAYQHKVQPLDEAHAQALGIQPGDTLTWGAAKQKIKNNISLKKFHQICASCAWKSLGVCKAALKNLSRAV